MSNQEDHNNENLEVDKTIIINASPEVVFKAITMPEELTNWFPDQATIEPVVGAKVQFITLREKHPEYNLDKDYIMEGAVKESIQNRKLSYTWKYDDTPDFPETLVTWELDKIDSNNTKLKLIHSGFTGNEKGMVSFESHNQGWTDVLDKLSKYCERNRNK